MATKQRTRLAVQAERTRPVIAAWYGHNGRRKQRSTRTTDKAAAEHILSKRMGDERNTDPKNSWPILACCLLMVMINE